MTIVPVLSFILLSALACALVWLVLSIAGGAVLYCSSFTTDHASFQPKRLRESEARSPLYAHTRDPRVMEPIAEGRERWAALRASGEIEDITILSRDGLSLAGYYWASSVEVDADAPAVILAHGMMDSAAGMCYLAEEYHALGWIVLAVDHRSHGESDGTKRTMGVREGEDIGAWVSWLLDRERACRIYLHGVSMGAAAVLLYAAGGMPPAVRGLIADSAFASHGEVFERLVAIAAGNSLVAKSLSLGSSLASFVATGVSFRRMAPRRVIGRIAVPILFFHGQNDVLVPIGMVRDIFQAPLKPGSESVVIPGAPHIGPFFYARDLYMRKIREFNRRTQ
jgi:fermentation-respiration switch protein FrsA (DUF1100 family)